MGLSSSCSSSFVIDSYSSTSTPIPPASTTTITTSSVTNEKWCSLARYGIIEPVCARAIDRMRVNPASWGSSGAAKTLDAFGPWA